MKFLTETEYDRYIAVFRAGNQQVDYDFRTWYIGKGEEICVHELLEDLKEAEWRKRYAVLTTTVATLYRELIHFSMYNCNAVVDVNYMCRLLLYPTISNKELWEKDETLWLNLFWQAQESEDCYGGFCASQYMNIANGTMVLKD